jgi:hypothetical protein
MQGEELQFSVSHHLLPLAKVPAAESGRSLIDKVSASIQGLVNDEISKRTILNEQNNSDR